MTSPNASKNVATTSPSDTAAENDNIGKKLFAYALAASIGAILVPSEAAAKVVYTPIYAHTIDPIQGISIDLDHNGIVDFVVASSNFSGVNTVSVRPSVTGNQLLSTLSHGEPAAAALRPGAYIGTGAKFAANANYMAFSYQCADFQGGPWAYARGRYLGLKFIIRGNVHYGWARLNVGRCGTAMTGFAYETIPNRPIQAGLTQSSDDMGTFVPQTLLREDSPALKPATLGLLAQGASGLLAWRRQEGLLPSI
jgi:hypothetical protein